VGYPGRISRKNPMKTINNVAVGFVLECTEECLTVMKITGVPSEGLLLKSGCVPRRYRFDPDYVLGHYYGGFIGQGRLYRPCLEELEGTLEDCSGSFVCFPTKELQVSECFCSFTLRYPNTVHFELVEQVWYPIHIYTKHGTVGLGIYRINDTKQKNGDGEGTLKYVCVEDFRETIDCVELWIHDKKVGEAGILTSP
jgi:hypothetical protein